MTGPEGKEFDVLHADYCTPVIFRHLKTGIEEKIHASSTRTTTPEDEGVILEYLIRRGAYAQLSFRISVDLSPL